MRNYGAFRSDSILLPMIRMPNISPKNNAEINSKYDGLRN